MTRRAANDSPGRLLILAFRLTLYLYPPEFRARFADGMLDTFCERYCERVRGRLSGLALCGRTFANLVSQGVAERLRPSFDSRWSERQRRRLSAIGWIALLLQDARFAIRSLRRQPGFALLAIVTLALGIGANSAIFSVVNGVLLKPLPYPESEGIISVLTDWRGADAGQGGLSYPDLLDLADQAPSLESLVGVNSTSSTLTGMGEPRVLRVTRLTDGLMRSFRVAPHLGRDLRADEFGPDGPRVVVIGYGFWQSQFGGDPDVVGRSLTLDGNAYEVVGVAPAGFGYPEGRELWIPRRLDPEDCGRGCHTMVAVGRLAPGATLGQARAEVETIAGGLAAEYPDTNTDKGFLVRSLQDEVVGEVRPGLVLMLLAVGLVVLIACANVTNLLLARAANRSGEIAIRTAIGANRGHLLSQALVESSILAFLGGGLGLGLAASSLELLPGFVTGLPRIHAVTIDFRVVVFTLGTVVAVTLLFGTAPAFALLRSSSKRGLARAGGSSESMRRGHLRGLLLVAEVALSTLLLIGAGLVMRSFVALYSVDLGFETSDMVRFNTLLPKAEYRDLARVRAFYRELEESARALPGVESVGSAWGPPLSRSRAGGDVLVEGRPDPVPGENRGASVKPVGPGWFETMGIEVLRGRGLDVSDDAGGEPVALVNETFVREHFPDEDPIGRRMELSVDLGYGSPIWRIVGVVPDVRARRLDEDPDPHLYVPHGLFGPNALTVTVRSRPGAPSPVPALREIVSRLDPNVPIYRLETLEEAVAQQVAPLRFYLVLISVFATLAAALAAIGLYGVVSYGVSRRTRELGLRAALGASRPGLVRMVLVSGMAPAFLGLLMGLVAAWFASRMMVAMLFGVEARDPWIFGLTGALLMLVSALATVVPAWRASRVDPATALRID